MSNAPTLRRVLMGSALVLSLSMTVAACNRAEKVDQTKTPAEVAEVNGPLTYEAKTPYAKVALTLPEAIKAYPALYGQLYNSEVDKLKDYAEGAQSDRSEFGSSNLPPYEKTIIYGQPVETSRLFSLIRTDFDYSGGAHPNTVATATLWDKTTNKQISSADLLASNADQAALSRILCDAVNAAKRGRSGSVQLTASGGTWSCPDPKKVPVALAASDATGKASGLTFLLDAYLVGPYVEGPYYLTVPFETLSKAINPTFASEFGGTGKSGDVTNSLRPE